MSTKFYKSEDKAPPKDKLIIGVFIADDGILIGDTYWNVDAGLWLFPYSNNYVEEDPVLWAKYSSEPCKDNLDNIFNIRDLDKLKG